MTDGDIAFAIGIEITHDDRYRISCNRHNGIVRKVAGPITL